MGGGGAAGNSKTLSFQNEESTLKADNYKNRDAVPEAWRENPKQLVEGGEIVASGEGIRERVGGRQQETAAFPNKPCRTICCYTFDQNQS